MASLDTFVLRSIEQVRAIADSWRELLDRSSAAEIFRSPDWLTAWWEVFGQEGNFQPLVIGVRQQGTLVGLAPLVIRSVRALGRPTVRRLGFMGTGEDEADEVCSDFADLIAAPGYEQVVCAEIWRVLQEEERGWDEACWGNLLSSSILCRYLGPMARDAGLAVASRPAGERYFVDLSHGDFASYVEGLSKNRKKRIYYYRRRMEKEGGLTERRLQSAEEIPFFLSEIARLNRQRQGEKGESSAWRSEKFRRFHDLVAPRLHARGWLDLRMWLKEGRCVAALYDLVYAGTIYYYQSGFDTPAFGNVSPGLLTLSEVIEWGFLQGQRRFDFLVGAQGSYKEDYACRTEAVLDLQLYNRTFAGQLIRSASEVRRMWRAARSRLSRNPDSVLRPDGPAAADATPVD
jgi:CelD/BcsL family acetyltransferase involved in cellulose biosynthesis